MSAAQLAAGRQAVRRWREQARQSHSHCKPPQLRSRSLEFSPGVRKVASWFPPVASLCQRLTTRNWTSSGTTPLPPPPSASGFPTFRRQCRWSGRPALPPTWRRPPPDSDPPSGSPSWSCPWAGYLHARWPPSPRRQWQAEDSLWSTSCLRWRRPQEWFLAVVCRAEGSLPAPRLALFACGQPLKALRDCWGLEAWLSRRSIGNLCSSLACTLA